MKDDKLGLKVLLIGIGIICNGGLGVAMTCMLLFNVNWKLHFNVVEWIVTCLLILLALYGYISVIWSVRILKKLKRGEL